jgi:hypothetical protein
MKFLIHGTTAENAKKIIQEGVIRPSDKENIYPGVYFALSWDLNYCRDPMNHMWTHFFIMNVKTLWNQTSYHANRFANFGHIDLDTRFPHDAPTELEGYINNSEDFPEVIFHDEVPLSALCGIWADGKLNYMESRKPRPNFGGPLFFYVPDVTGTPGLRWEENVYVFANDQPRVPYYLGKTVAMYEEQVPLEKLGLKYKFNSVNVKEFEELHLARFPGRPLPYFCKVWKPRATWLMRNAAMDANAWHIGIYDRNGKMLIPEEVEGGEYEFALLAENTMLETEVDIRLLIQYACRSSKAIKYPVEIDSGVPKTKRMTLAQFVRMFTGKDEE